ncbi:MAG TPA: GntR family transcriptional regulator [Pseudolabrys sp.]|nr:GntR family transcriptional regulator [Pseudolabrys sp.]
MPRTSLVAGLANEIQEMIRSGGIAVGSHLSAQKLADQFDVSRSPVRQAMELLAKKGVLELRENRGFFARTLSARARKNGAPASAPLLQESKAYQKLADEWLDDRVPSEVTEQFIRRRYRLTKAEVTELFMRASREGWAERRHGYGWRLLPVAKTPESFEQIYRFRMIIEPAAMLEPTFALDPKVLAEQRRIQEGMLSDDIGRLPAERLLHNGSLFHEELIKLSGNPFFYRALVQINRMRRLLEYRARVDLKRLQVQCSQHLEILAALEKGDVMQASFLMRNHLSGALARKSPVVLDAPRKRA